MTPKDQALHQIFKQLSGNEYLEVHNGPWHNFAHNLAVEAMIVDIDDIRALSALMKIVHEHNQILKNNHQPIIFVRAAAGWKNKPKDTTFGWELSNTAWKNEQTNRYNDSFSITPPISEGDIIVRFSPKFQEKYYRQDGTNVIVPAGMQVGELARRMDSSTFPLSLPTSSMIWAVSAVGLAANSGHGTGRDQPGFAGLIKKMDVIDDEGYLVEMTETSIQRFKLDNDGNILEAKPLRSFPYSATIFHAHMGMFGIVTNIVINAEPSFKLKEKRYTNKTFEGLTRSVSIENHLKKEYSTFMWMPGHSNNPHFEFRHWERTQEAPTLNHPVFEPSKLSRQQEIEIQLNAVADELVYNRGRNELIPMLQKFGSMLAIGEKSHDLQPDIRIGKELDITHYQVSFPNDLIDISLLFPVKDKDAAALFHHLISITDTLLNDRPFDKACPIAYAVYARYLKGNNGGLSPLRTQDDEHILAFEWVTNPKAPQLSLFLKELFNLISHNPYAQPRFHLGKFVPKNADFSTFLGQEAVKETKQALKAYYETNERLEASPFLTPYFISKFQGKSQNLLSLTDTAMDAALAPYQKHVLSSEKSDQDLLIKLYYCFKQLGHILTVEEKQLLQPHNEPVEVTRKHRCTIL